MAAVLVVCQGVLPALPGPLMAHEADEGRAPDDVGGGGGAQQSIEGEEALGRSRPPGKTSVTIAPWPPENRVAPLLVHEAMLGVGPVAPRPKGYGSGPGTIQASLVSPKPGLIFPLIQCITSITRFLRRRNPVLYSSRTYSLFHAYTATIP